MWHLFDRYTGVVWPKARQMNLIARILNNFSAGVGMKLTLPSNPSPSAPVVFALDTEWLADHVGGGGGGGEDDPSGGVKKLNGLDGEVEIRGMNGVAVSVDEESKTINISIDEAGEGGQDNCNGWSDEAEDDEASENDWSDGDPEGQGGGGGGGGGGYSVGGNGWTGDNCEELNGWA